MFIVLVVPNVELCVCWEGVWSWFSQGGDLYCNLSIKISVIYFSVLHKNIVSGTHAKQLAKVSLDSKQGKNIRGYGKRRENSDLRILKNMTTL